MNILNILIHVLAWVGIFILLDMSIPISISDIPYGFHIKVLITVLIAIVVFYINTQVLIPHLLFKKRIIAYVLVIIGIVVISYELSLYVSNFLDFNKILYQIDEIIYGQDQLDQMNAQDYEDDEIEDVPTLLIIFVITFGIIISFAIQHYKNEKEKEKIKLERKTAELAFLKNQVNPHFVFNTLNNIYALISIDPQKARKTILQLSQIIRYMLYGADHEKVSLKLEIDFISEYIELMRLRLNDKNVVNLDIDKSIDLDKKIPPLLFIPFIENAFKHGGGSEAEIYIKIDQELNELKLKVVNKITDVKNEIGGLGLSNVKKRLELLFPPNVYSLEIKTKERWFKVELRIKV